MANLVDLPQDAKDSEQLNILRICHYVVGGMSMLFSCFFLFHIVAGLFFVKETIGMTMAAMGLLMMISGWAYGALIIAAGKCIARRKHRNLIIVASALNCFNFPLGLLLGIFTFIVIGRNSVKEEFEAAAISGATVPHRSLRTETSELDLSKVPDPDEEMWLEMERKADKTDAENLKVEDFQKES